MAKHGLRRHRRISCTGSIRISWQDASGQTKFAIAKCREISEAGLRLEVPEPIPVRNYVNLKSEHLAFATTASVRHCSRCGGKFIIGLEFGGGFRSQLPESASLPGEADSLVETGS